MNVSTYGCTTATLAAHAAAFTGNPGLDRDGKCTLPYFNVEETDERVWEIVEEYVSDPEFTRQRFEGEKEKILNRPDESHQELEEVEAELRVANRSLDNLMDFVALGKVNKQKALDRAGALERLR
jgi:hypothetical protein